MLRATSAFLAIALAATISFSCGPKTAKDQTITTDIQAKLYADALTKAANIAVAVKDGAVTLSGDVPSSDVALEAMKVANGTSGVRSVSDKMTVNGTAAAVASNAPADNATAAPPPPSAPPSAPPPGQANQPAAAPSRPPEPETITFPAGEHLQVRTIDAISSATSEPGQFFRASLNAPLTREGRVIIPAGAPVSLEVTAARAAGRIKGRSELEVRASRIQYHGHSYRLDTSVFADQGKARGKQTAVRTGVGAAAGAVIGAIAGGGKGAAIGSAVGGGAGFGSDVFTHGQQVKIPSEAVLTFRLEAPLRVER